MTHGTTKVQHLILPVRCQVLSLDSASTYINRVLQKIKFVINKIHLCLYHFLDYTYTHAYIHTNIHTVDLKKFGVKNFVKLTLQRN